MTGTRTPKVSRSSSSRLDAAESAIDRVLCCDPAHGACRSRNSVNSQRASGARSTELRLAGQRSIASIRWPSIGSEFQRSSVSTNLLMWVPRCSASSSTVNSQWAIEVCVPDADREHDRVAEAADPDPIDRDATIVALGLNVGHQCPVLLPATLGSLQLLERRRATVDAAACAGLPDDDAGKPGQHLLQDAPRSRRQGSRWSDSRARRSR